MRKACGLTAFVILAVMLTLGLSGCIEREGGEPPSWLSSSAEETQEPAEEPETPAPEGAHGHGTEVFMMGRSVMGGWFEHWGYDWEDPVLRDGYALYYREIMGPPDIGDDAASAVAELPPDTIVFFKLCFVDFWASSPGDVNANVEENMGYVRQVQAACEEQGLTLVVGNALPQVVGDTSPLLVRTHRAYNDALDQFASEHADVVVFDLYGLLAGQDGSLPKGLAVSPDDSHLNNVAYNVLDEAFFPLLDSVR